MANLLQELENNENILLMYLANELPAEDRAEVDSMLRTDASLRRELDRLRQSMGIVDQVLDRVDAASPLPQQSAVLGRLSQAMSQWKLEADDRAASEPAKIQPTIRRANWWTVAMTATAATVLIASSLTYLISDNSQRSPVEVVKNIDPPTQSIEPNSTVAFQNLYQAEDELSALLMTDPGGF